VTWNFNYNQTIEQAKRIETIAEDMRSLANGRLENAYDSIDAAWDGETSAIFLRHCGQTKAGLLERAGQLITLAGRMREVARILKEAEENAFSALQS
jgi:hypothetical protein